MLTEREQRIVADFRDWAKALRDNDVKTLRQIEREWHKDDHRIALGHVVPYRKGSF